ncbi:nitrate ABC transporter permease [Mesorhizobium loti]|nr:ABC transporter permease [Mesorhizobium loti]PLP59287.1 nitrate ABC transporter permease [Mesorhizobium loti]
MTGKRRDTSGGSNSRTFLKTFSPILSVLAGLALWEALSRQVLPLFLPSPLATARAAVELWSDGTIVAAVAASLRRIAIGWGLGVLLGIPLGIFMGSSVVVRRLLDPYIDFFRFIPPIAFVTLAIIWLGPGEASKVGLIFYATIFVVIVSMIAGVQAVNPARIRAAATLGAGRLRILLTVVIPSTVPAMVTGARLAMGNSFLTVVSAEIVAAQEGVGALIWTARNYGRTEWVFVGIILLGLLGYLCDRLLRLCATRFLKRYDVKT